ncbi:hypothetical protein [Mycobacterium sp.]|uniref:hypothetical protein n=1 Tax=Mycobacterium sp. TaxID=1785 RepID=UPI001205A835|nr:hypothetical protein [Mycobacterium sp.]TAM62853.1 MAG: hypothetical protein EPN51_28885 [Mycobacterium sp.]
MTTTSAERTALLKLVARNTKIACADLDALAAAQYAEFERQMTKLWEAQELGVQQLIAEGHELLAPVLAEAKRLVDERCEAMGIVAELRPRVDGGIALGWGPERLSRERKTEIRRAAKAEIEARKRRAKTEVERARGKQETLILTGAIETAEGKAILESLPSADELLPALGVADVEALLATQTSGGA